VAGVRLAAELGQRAARSWVTGMAIVSAAGLVIAVCFVLFAGLVTDWIATAPPTSAGCSRCPSPVCCSYRPCT